MKIYEIGTGYTPIPAQMGAATEIVVEGLTRAFLKLNMPVEIIDIKAKDRVATDLPVQEVWVPGCFAGTDVKLGLMHKLKRVVYSVCLAAKLQKLLKNAAEETVLHFHNQYNLFFFLKLTPAKLRKKALIAYTNHSGIWRLDWQEIEETIKRRYFQEAAAMKNADIVFLLNQETKNNIMEHLGVPEERIVLIGNGVDTDTYRPLSEREKEAAKESWGFQNKKVILQVGSVNENKGQLRAVEYLLPLLKKNPNLVYAYAGGIVDENYQEQVQVFAKENGLTEQICYLGMVTPGRQLNELYNTATATMLSSRYEGCVLVGIESLAAGVPVLVEQKSPIDFGEGCMRCCAAQFEDVINHLLTEDPVRLCKAARDNAVSHYSWDAVSADYEKAIRNRMKQYV